MAVSDWIHHQQPLRSQRWVHTSDEGFPKSESEFLSDANLFIVVELLLCFFCPPLAVGLERGCTFDLLLSAILTCLFWVPGVLHAYWIVLRYESRYGTWREMRLQQLDAEHAPRTEYPHLSSSSSDSELEMEQTTAPPGRKKRGLAANLDVLVKPARDWDPPSNAPSSQREEAADGGNLSDDEGPVHSSRQAMRQSDDVYVHSNELEMGKKRSSRRAKRK